MNATSKFTQSQNE
jgi:hypothetical protein